MVVDLDSIQTFFSRPPEVLAADPEAPAWHQVLLAALEAGSIRAAERRSDGTWQANAWVKQAILCGFRRTHLVEMPGPGFPMFDKTAYPVRHFGLEDGVRLVPGGSAVRRGAHIARGVVLILAVWMDMRLSRRA